MKCIFTFSILVLLSLYSLSAQAVFNDLSDASGFNHTGSNYGVAIGDYDNDGWEDVYVTRSNDPNLLYRNNGDGTFTEKGFLLGVGYLGVSYVATWGDIDNDGDLDLYLGNRNEPNYLYRNNGNGTFYNATLFAGVADEGAPRSVLMADVDQDGWLDIYVANLSAENVLYHNNRDGTFTDRTQEFGVSDTQISMGSIFFDYDNDGDQDLYLTHDNNEANILYQNDGTGHFTDVSAASGTDYEGFGMGVDIADVNRDGWLDIYITNLGPNVLYLNNGDGTFTDVTESAGVGDVGMGWGTALFDYDNDGWVDIYTVNDYLFSPYPNVLYRNMGDGSFSIVSEDNVLSSPYATYGCGTTDLDKDGLVDLFLTNRGNNGGGNQYFQNATPNAGHWLEVELEGVLSNRSAIGARVTLYCDDEVFVDEINAGSGYTSQNSLTLHFGLDTIEQVDELVINWPSGREDVYTAVPVNQRLSYVESEPVSVIDPNQPPLQISIGPNPASSYLQVDLTSPVSGPVMLQLLDLEGRVLSTHKESLASPGTLSWRLDQQDMPKSSGVYFIQLGVGNHQIVRELVWQPY